MMSGKSGYHFSYHKALSNSSYGYSQLSDVEGVEHYYFKLPRFLSILELSDYENQY